MNTDRTIKIIDSTLRDGEQAPGVVFSLNEKLNIAQKLDEIGIEELEVGSPFISENEINTIKTIINSGFNFRSSCWSRARFDDIEAASKTKASGINISYPVSDIQIAALGKTKDWIFMSMPIIVKFAKERFEYVSLGAQDASRADFDFLCQYIKMADELGVHRLRIADTVGILNPFSTQRLIQNSIKSLSKSKMEIEFHGHNDLGMATANSLSALIAGANSVSVTVNGLGERSGNAALEEVIMALKLTTDFDCLYNTSIFSELSYMVEKASGRKLQSSKPIVGEMTHKHESGIHTSSLLKDKKSYEPFSPNEIGKSESTFVFGTHSGSYALNAFLEYNSIFLNQKDLKDLLSKIKQISTHKKTNLTNSEVIELAASYQKEESKRNSPILLFKKNKALSYF